MFAAVMRTQIAKLVRPQTFPIIHLTEPGSSLFNDANNGRRDFQFLIAKRRFAANTAACFKVMERRRPQVLETMKPLRKRSLRVMMKSARNEEK